MNRTYLAVCLLALAGPWPTPATAGEQRIAIQPESPPSPRAGSPKRATAAARLLLPFYEVDTVDASGATTFFSLRNEVSQGADVRVSLYATDRPQSPLHSQTLTLAGKELRSFNVRSLPNLRVDADGFARGYAVAETVSGEAVLQGEYFQLTPGEAFATGSRLVNIDPSSTDNDLCSSFTIRFLNGGGFDGGTVLTLWMDLDLAPEDTPVLSYAVYNQAGGTPRLVVADFPANRVAFRLAVEDLVSQAPTNFGAIELQLSDGVRGHLSATMSALGLYSVGLEAVCTD